MTSFLFRFQRAVDTLEDTLALKEKRAIVTMSGMNKSLVQITSYRFIQRRDRASPS